MRYSRKKNNVSINSKKKKSTKLNRNSNKSVVITNSNSTRKSRRKRRVKAKSKSRITPQDGGGPLSSIMSLVSSSPLEEEEDIDEQDSDNSVLVEALCNQYFKNNIRGNIKTEYDPVLDSLCNNSIYSNSNFSINSNKKIKKNKKKVKKSKKIQKDVSNKSQMGGVKMPSFLDGVKGLANLYSAPIKMGYNAINSLNNYRKTRSASSSGSESSSSLPQGENIDEEIARAESEIKQGKKISDERAKEIIMENMVDNKNLDIKEVITKK